MRKHGWRSKAALQRAIDELLQTGFIVRTRLGGRNRAALYAITWLSINECGGKLDVRPTGPLQLWKDQYKDERGDYVLAGGNKVAAPQASQVAPPVDQSTTETKPIAPRLG